jgi:TP901 family phage tail tape measure protein
MATGGQIRYNVGFNIDKTGLNELTKTLQNVQQELNKTGNTNVDNSLKDGVKAAQQLESILNDAWNSKLNQLDLNKVNTGIKSTFGSVQQLKNEMEKGGATGSAAYNKIASSVLNTNLQLKQSNKLLDDMADTMAKTVKWGITSSIFNRITGSIQEAWGYTKRLDNSLNDIRIVTEKSAEAMQQFAREANNAAKSLGASTTDYTEASLIYFQQGLSDEEVAARAQTTIKAANVTGQSANEVSEQLTAVWNGYKASAQEAELYVDKLAAVAASTAADLEELSTGMSKVASAANSMGVDIDQLNAQLATIVSVTRQAPESVGTALKTIYARLGDLAVDGEDEFGVALGTVSKTMEEMGIQILDEQGQMREMGEVIEETAAKWDTWTEAQRQAAAVAIAGKRQYNNLVALFENWDMYTDALNTSVDATGTLQKQQDIYMESMEAHLQQMSTEAERTYDVLFNEEVIKDIADAITGVLTVFNDFIEGIGGGGKALLYFGTIAANVFNKQIANGIQKSIQNFQAWRANLKGGELKEEFIKAKVSKDNNMSGVDIANSKALEAQYKIAGDMLKVQKGLTIEQQQQYINIQRQVGLNTQQINLIQNYKEKAQELLDNEDATLIMAQAREKMEKANLAKQKEAQALYKENLMLIEEEGSTWANKKALMQSITALNSTLNLDAKEQLITEAAKKDILEQGRISETNRLQLEELINSKISTQKQFHADIVNLVKLMEAYENGEISALELQNQLLMQQKDILDQSGKSSINLQRGISGAMAAAQGLVSIMGALPTIMDETAGKAEVAQASFSATSGVISAIGSAIGSAFGPVGMAIGMVGSSIVSAIGSAVVKGIEEQEEKIKKVKEDWQNLAGEVSSTHQNIGSLNSIASEFEYLSAGVSKYGENISLTADEYERYQDLINEIVGISPDVVEGYTNEGQAIVNNNGLIERTIKLLKEEQLARKQALFTPDNIKIMAGKAEEEYDKAKDSLNDLQSDFSANTLFTSVELAADVPKNLSLAALGGEIEFDSSEAADQFMADRKELMDLFYDTSIIPETGEVYYGNVNSNKILENREEIYKKLQEMQSKYNISDESIFGKGGSFETVEEFYTFTEDPFNVEEFNKKYENAKADIEEKTKGFNSQVITWMEAFNGSYQDMSAEQQLLIQNYINSFTTETFDEETFNTFTENATKFTDLFTKLDEDTQNELLKLSDPSNYDTYKDYLNGLWSFIKESGLTEEQLQEVAASLDISDMYLNENNQAVVADDTITKIHNLNNQIREKIGDEDFDLAEYFSFGEIESGSLENMAGIDLTKITSIDDFIAKLNIIRESDATKELQKSFENIKLSIETIDGALDEFNSNGEISTETIEKLEKEYTQLGEIQNKNSHEYIQALREIRETEEDNAKKALEDKIESLSKQAKFYIDVDTEKFDSVMKELISTKYQLQVEINADLASDIEDGFGLAAEFETLRGYITDDLKISFEQAQDFIAKGYGDILTYAQETNEGVIQLNADQVKSFILGKKAELEVDKESKIEQLTRQREMLTSQLEILETQLAAYTAASISEDEIDRTKYINEGIRAEQSYQNEVNLLNEELKKDDEQKIELSDNANKFYGVLSSIYQKDAENSMTADQEADAATKQYQKNVIEYYRAMHTAVSQYADAVKAAPAGKKVDFSATAMVGDFINTEVKGIESPNQEYESGVTELLAIEDLFNNEWSGFGEEDQQDIAKKLATDTQKRIDTLKSQIGSIDSAIAALKTSGSTFDETYSGIGTKTEKNNEKNRDTVEILEDVYDRYREINIILSTLETNL